MLDVIAYEKTLFFLNQSVPAEKWSTLNYLATVIAFPSWREVVYDNFGYGNCVLESIYMSKLASIQPRTSRLKLVMNWISAARLPQAPRASAGARRTSSESRDVVFRGLSFFQPWKELLLASEEIVCFLFPSQKINCLREMRFIFFVLTLILKEYLKSISLLASQ